MVLAGRASQLVISVLGRSGSFCVDGLAAAGQWRLGPIRNLASSSYSCSLSNQPMSGALQQRGFGAGSLQALGGLMPAWSMEPTRALRTLTASATGGAKAPDKAKPDGDKPNAQPKAKAVAKTPKTVAKPKKVAPRSPYSAVKRAPSQFNLFVKERFSSERGDSKLPAPVIMKALAAKFKEIPASELERLKEQAAGLAAAVKEQRSKIQVEQLARFALSPYILFNKEALPRAKRETPAEPMSVIMKRVSAVWKNMSTADKQPYVDLAKADRLAKGLPKCVPKKAKKADGSSSSSDSD